MSQTFADAERGIRATNPSTTDQDLVELLERHGADEGEILGRYESLLTNVRSPAVSYLVNFIFDDERRHHRTIEEIANSVAWSAVAPKDAPSVPELGASRGETPEFIAETRRLLAFEKQDRRSLRKLRKELNSDGYADTTIWSLLVDTMIIDTNKHITILKFLLRHLATEPASPSRP